MPPISYSHAYACAKRTGASACTRADVCELSRSDTLVAAPVLSARTRLVHAIWKNFRYPLYIVLYGKHCLMSGCCVQESCGCRLRRTLWSHGSRRHRRVISILNALTFSNCCISAHLFQFINSSLSSTALTRITPLNSKLQSQLPLAVVRTTKCW